MMIEESCVDNLHEDKTKNDEDSNENTELRNISDDTKPIVVSKKRIIAFSDSDSDVDTEIKNIRRNVSTKTTSTSSSDETCNTTEPIKYESARTENKKKKLRDKFKKLKVPHSQKVILEAENDDSNDSGARRDESDDEISCRNIIEEVKKSAFTMKSICDPDTSDEEDKDNSKISSYKKKHKTVKSTSPKPLRMSAKQAMENMQKIKSESNRMLREREISLPYHRPKALSLKDIMSRRKLAVSSDGKALPIKMSSDQLKLYATMLEQRQKEVIELCKSESEDEIPENDEVTNVYSNDIMENKTSEDNSTTENETVTNKEIVLDNETYNIEENNILNNKEGQESINCDLEEKSCPNITVNVKQTIASVNTEEKLVIDAETSETSLLQYSTENDLDMDTSNVQQNELSKTSINSIKEDESQVMMLHYDSEAHSVLENKNVTKNTSLHQNIDDSKVSSEDEFMDNDFNFDEISKIIDEAELNGNETFKETINNTVQANAMPKLTGCPGTLIELDEKGAGPQKLSGVEMLKERYSYFAKLKSLEDMEKDREKKYKPGTQHLKLKQELEQQIAEQRSMEWEKRLEEESKLKAEMTTNISDDEIEKIEANLESETEEKIVDSSESEEEPIENDVILEDKPKKRNPMVDDEAEVSDCDETVDNNEQYENGNNVDDDGSMDEESSDSSESEEEPVDDNKPKKGRILKAFEDSDDEACDDVTSNKNNENLNLSVEEHKTTQSDIKDSQDDDLQLAQANRSSQDLFSTQESNPNPHVVTLNRNNEGNASSDLGTQTFSIMKSVTVNSSKELMSPDKLLESQSQYLNIESEGLSQNILSTQSLQSQEIGDDIAALCTGKFYDNPFVSQDENIKNTQKSDDMSGIAALCTGKFYDNPFVSQMPNDDTNVKESDKENNRNEAIGDATDKIDTNEKLTLGIEPVTEPNILKSVLDELDGPDVVPKRNKYFFISSKEYNLKKKFIIDSDDETNDTDTHKRVKKLKKRKAEQRALQISDDEEDELEDEEAESEIEENEDKLVEYDSEENEVEVQQKPLKKKRVGDFFENEAELTSEDEWIGSGDEDERDLDVMEREEGDDETFQQDQLQKELGQIHMREVLDQDKREVRLLQELLFEDGDLGDGHRQRKFRWRNADGEIETGTNPDEFLDTQEDDFESEEQWRKQRHERETFLRQMQDKEEDVNTSINRTTIIKANLNSRSMSTLIAETKTDKIEKITSPDAVQKKNSKDIPSPKKPFTILQQNYHGSLLTRGRGALARLAALATPLATDDDTPKAIGSTNRGNFVFTSINPEEKPKVTKRKAETNVGTPRLIKKMKTDETSKYLKSSLFDHLKT